MATLTYGGFSEFAVEDARRCVPVAAATPEVVAFLTSGLTASIALEQAGLRRGCTVLVTAAAGGTGMFAVQLARRAGAHVVGTCGSDAKARMLRRLGVQRPINYKQEDLRQVRCLCALGQCCEAITACTARAPSRHIVPALRVGHPRYAASHMHWLDHTLPMCAPQL